MLIDLHCHTRNIKSGDGAKREVTDELFAQKIKSSGVGIVAITNHNHFDGEQFVRLQGLVVDDCKLWPGVELDVGYGSEGGRYHLLVVCNPKNIIPFSEAVDTVLKGHTAETFVGAIEELVSVFDPLDCLYLPHFHKTPAIPEEEFIKLETLLTNKNRLIAEATNVRSMGIFSNHGITSIAGSDIKDWDLYPNMELPELRLQIEEYEHFCKLLDRDSTVVKTLLDKNTVTPYEVYPSDKDRTVKERHGFYGEVNVIFGDKGTGKTQILKSLIDKLKTEDIPYSKYISSETKEDLAELLELDDMERLSEKLGIDDCLDDFAEVVVWGDKTPTPISSYIEYHRTYSAKANEQAVGWSRARDMSDDVDIRLEKVHTDLEAVEQVSTWMEEIDPLDYLEEAEAEGLASLQQKLRVSINETYEATVVESKAFELVNFTIDKFRTHTSAKTGNAIRPSNTGFEQYAKNRLKLESSINNIKDKLKFSEKKSYVPLGSTGGKGKIEIEYRYRMLNKHEDTKSSHVEFNRNITKLHETHALINKISSLSLSIELDDTLVDLKDAIDEAGVLSVSDFVGLHKQTVDKNRQPYTLSSGERSIIFIQRALEDKDARVFILDEPELSMANSYIDEVIRPKITELGKQKKTVIMATHNANLAVRTLPYKTMYRCHDERGYNTYVGNPFTNQLTNINDDSDTKDWKETSMKILEGGKEAFYDREGIYESGR